jgi:carbonic anhydrase/acetyltransferase-like protein (isoleucine patch superfamily)
VLPLGDRVPRVDPSAFLAPGASVLGDVTIGARSGVWYTTVLRADTETITVGAGTNLQDGCVVHADPGFPAVIGDDVSVGHRAVLHGCVIAGGVLIGMGAVVLNGARVGAGSLVAAGAVVPEGAEIPEGSLVAGVPGKVRRGLSAEERADIIANAARYRDRAAEHHAALAG